MYHTVQFLKVFLLIGVILLSVPSTVRAEPMSMAEVIEAHQLPIPCHQIKAAHWVYSLREVLYQVDGLWNALTGVGNNIEGMRVSRPLPANVNDLVEQHYVGYTGGEKAFLVPFVDIADGGQFGEEIKYWIVYRPVKMIKNVYSDALLYQYTLIHPLYYSVYSKLRKPRPLSGKIQKPQWTPFLVESQQRERAEVDWIDDEIPVWDTVRMEDHPASHRNKYVISEMCYPTAVYNAQRFTQAANCTFSGKQIPTMPTDINAYLSGTNPAKPDCLGHNMIKQRQLTEQEGRYATQEGVLRAGLESLPGVGPVCTAMRCEDFEDYRCWADVGVGILGDAGSMLMPITKAGKLGMILRGTGRVMVGAAAAGNIALSIDAVREGRDFEALTRVLNAGFNVLELRVAVNDGIYGGRKIDGPDTVSGSGCTSGRCTGKGMRVIKSEPGARCTLATDSPCVQCRRQLSQDWLNEAQRQAYKTHRDDLIGIATDAADNPEYDAYAQILALRDADGRYGGVSIQDMGDELTLDGEDLLEWERLTATLSDDAARQAIESRLRFQYLSRFDHGQGFFYNTDLNRVQVGRLKVDETGGVRTLRSNGTRTERILREIENKLNIEELAHSVAMRDNLGVRLLPVRALGRGERAVYPFYEKVIQFKCWLDDPAVSNEALVKIARELGIDDLSPDEILKFKGSLRHQLEEVDVLVLLRANGHTLTDSWLSPYPARRMFLYWEEHVAKAAN